MAATKSSTKSSTTKLWAAAGAAVLLAVAGFMVFGNHATAATETLIVYKTPTCGCCGGWVEHMEANGFKVEVNDLDDLTGIKNVHAVPTGVRTCHTAVIGGYTVEGHVPAEYVHRLLEEKPDITGIAVAGMPMGSPGMEGSYRATYDVLAFNDGGRTAVWATVQGDPGR